MARLTDPEKLERIKRATMALVNQLGYQGVTTARIAEKAKVSAGYLYHHFDSKEQLINSLIEECHVSARSGISQLIEKGASLRDMIHHAYGVILSVANADPVQAEFLYVLSHDPHFREYAISSSLYDIVIAVDELRSFAIEHKQIDPATTLAEMMVFMIEVPIGYLYLRIKEADTATVITEDEISRLTDKCLRALQ